MVLIPSTGCGNGTRDAGEQCDDGNNFAGDGCSASCTVEFQWVCEDVAAPVQISAALGFGVTGLASSCYLVHLSNTSARRAMHTGPVVGHHRNTEVKSGGME